MKIAVFYHCLFVMGDPPEPVPHGIAVVSNQMEILISSGLLDAASEFYVGINGSEETQDYADMILPEKAVKVYHGLQCKNELRTMMFMQQMMLNRPGWKVLYFHAKGFRHSPDNKMIANWRWCMMRNLVVQWDVCVASLDSGFDSCGCHWKTGQVDGTQNIWAGNFWWAKSDFMNTLHAIESHPRIAAMGGIDSPESRYEAEVWLGSGPRRPKVNDFHSSGPFNCSNY